MGFGRTVGLAAAIVLAAAAPAQAATKVEHLSRPGKESFFGFVEKAETVRAQPKASARKVSKLTRKSPEGTDDLVMVLDRTTVKDKVWLRVRLPIRPNGTTGWVPETALSELQPVDTWLKISTKTFKVTLIKSGKTIFTAASASDSRSGRPPRVSSSSAPSSRSSAARARSSGRSRSSPARRRRR